MSLTLHSLRSRNLPSGLLLLTMVICWFIGFAANRNSPVSTSVTATNIQHFRIPEGPLDRLVGQAKFALDFDAAALKVRPQFEEVVRKIQSRLQSQALESSAEFSAESLSPSSELSTHSRRSLLSFLWRDRALAIAGSLEQSPLHNQLFSGRVTARIQIDGFQPQPPGFSLQELNSLPQDTQRFLVLDTRGLTLPEAFRQKLEVEWKKWEFSPLTELAPAVASPFILLESDRGRRFELRLNTSNEVEAFLEKRFPNSVLKSLSRWHFGTKVHAFNESQGPAWAVRSNTLIAIPDGGLRKIKEHIAALVRGKTLLQEQDHLAEELKRVTGTQDGWNVCLSENNLDLGLRWLILLRWPEQANQAAEGFLILDLASSVSIQNGLEK